MATCLSKQLRRLGPADCLAVADAYSTWCIVRQQQQQQQHQQHQQEDEESLATSTDTLAAGLLVQMSANPQQYSALQLCTAISSIAVQMQYTPIPSRVQDAAALQALKTLLQELSHAQVLAAVPTRQVLALLQGLNCMQVQPEHGFMAAVQRDALLPRLRELKPRQFAEVTQGFAGLGVQMEKEVLDGFWQEAFDSMDNLEGSVYSQLF
jgi:hypothetical protein